MSIEYITAVWELSPYKAEKLVVQLACADWANHDGEFWPSLTEIARKARITKPGAIGIMEQLREDGEFIQLEANTGRGHTNRYRFGDRYQEAVQEIRFQWQQKREMREIKGKPPLPIQEGERVNDNIKRVNEEGEKGKRELAHIRKNRYEPGEEPSGEPDPDSVTISDALEDVYPGHATDIRLMNQLRDLVKRVDATPDHILAFPAWLSERYPTKANGPFAFKDLFPEYVKSSPSTNGNGNGNDAAKPAADRCTNCNGAGKSVRRGPDRFKPGQLLETCPVCDGTGTTTGAHHVSNRNRNRVTA